MRVPDDKFYMIDRELLAGIELRLDTEHDNDWMPVFVNREDHTYSQFNEAYDLTDNRPIRIHSDLALKIWEMVELSDVMSVKRAEIKAEMNFEEDFNN